MQVDAGEFVERLRGQIETLAESGLDYSYSDMLAIYDRACVKALVAAHNGRGRELTPQQRGARTRAENRKKAEEQVKAAPEEKAS